MPANTIRHGARAFALTAIVVACAGACQARDITSGANAAGNATPTATAAPDAAQDPAIQSILAKVQAARTRHDARALHQFRAELRDLAGNAAIERADAAYRRVVADLQAAEAAHDARALAAFRAELRALCDPTGLTGAIEPCDGVAAAAG